MMPFALIDCASSWSLASSIVNRGWCSFGESKSMSTSMVPVRIGSGASGIRALSPFPRAGRRSSIVPPSGGVAGEHFLREGRVSGGSARLGIVKSSGHAVAWRLTEFHVARDDGVENFLFKELQNIGGDERPKIGPVVVHRQKPPVDLERGIQPAANPPHRAYQIGESLEREVLTMQWNEHGVSGH